MSNKDDTITINQDHYFNLLRAGYGVNEEKAVELGLRKVWVYHCMRCNYHWLPRDVDITIDEAALFTLKPPKVCARCKTRYWNKVPRRNTPNVDSMLSVARLRAIARKNNQV